MMNVKLTQALHAAEAKLDDAKDAYHAAQKEHEDAAKAFAAHELEQRGITLNETILIAPEWGFSKHSTVAAMPTRISSSGDLVLQEVTKSNKIHRGRSPFTCSIDRVTIQEPSND